VIPCCLWADSPNEEKAVSPHVTALPVLSRVDAVENVEVAYHEDVLTTDPKTGEGTLSSVEFVGKADTATSSGWTLSITRKKGIASAIFTAYDQGNALQYSLVYSGGKWSPGGQGMLIRGQEPVEVCLSFCHRSHLPAKPVPSSGKVLVLVDDMPTELEVTALRDADSSTTLFVDEVGLLGFEGRSPVFDMTETVVAFTRNPVLELVPKQKVTMSRHRGTRGVTESESRFRLRNLAVNSPGFSLSGDENTSAAILLRHSP
jgi:hypothetical protein